MNVEESVEFVRKTVGKSRQGVMLALAETSDWVDFVNDRKRPVVGNPNVVVRYVDHV